jgi:hypothetical protein
MIFILLLNLFYFTNAYIYCNNIPIKIYNPINKQNLPCVIFLTGLNNNIPNYTYDLFLKELSKETTIISIEQKWINPKDFSKTTEKISNVIEWCQNDLNLYLNKYKCTYNNNLSVISHSSSAQAIINYLQTKNYENINSLILIDPVDGDLYHNINRVLYKSIKINKPLLIISNKYGNNFKYWPNFNPDNISSKYFYNNIETKEKKILVSMLDYGHSDILNDDIVQLAEFFHIIKSYKKNNINSYKKYRELLSKIIINFINKDYIDLNMNIIQSNLLIDCINF